MPRLTITVDIDPDGLDIVVTPDHGPATARHAPGLTQAEVYLTQALTLLDAAMAHDAPLGRPLGPCETWWANAHGNPPVTAPATCTHCGHVGEHAPSCPASNPPTTPPTILIRSIGDFEARVLEVLVRRNPHSVTAPEVSRYLRADPARVRAALTTLERVRGGLIDRSSGRWYINDTGLDLYTRAAA